MNENIARPCVVLIRGLPGSGKSYLATSLAEALKKSLGQDQVVMLDPDATDYDSQAYLEYTKALTAEGVDPKLHAYRFLRAQAYDGIAGRHIVIWNQPFTNVEIFNKMVARLEDCASEHGTGLALLVVEMFVDAALAKERVAARKQSGGHGPSDAKFAQFTTDYTSVADQGYRTLAVAGDSDVATSVDSVLAATRQVSSL